MRRALGALLALGGLGFVVYQIASQRDEFMSIATRFDATPFSLGVGFLVVQTLCIAATWREMAAALGVDLTFARSYRLLYLAAIAKYLPGRVWGLAGVAAMAPEAGTSSRAAVTATVATMVAVAAMGALIGATAFGLDRLGLDTWWSLTAVILIATAPWLILHWMPGSLSSSLGSSSQFGSLLLLLQQRLRPLCRGAGWAGLSWLVVAVSQWLVARALYDVPPQHALALLASAALGWLAGIAALGVPAGLGVREAVQTLVLTPSVPPSTAAAVSVLTRASLILADLAALALAMSLKPTPHASLNDASLHHH